ELEHALSRAVIRALAEGHPRDHLLELAPKHLGAEDLGDAPASSVQEPEVALPQSMATMHEAVDDFRRQLIAARLATYDGNCAAAARSLGLDRGNFHRLLKKLGLRA